MTWHEFGDRERFAVEFAFLPDPDRDAGRAQADIATLHVPASDRTRGMVDAAFLARMKPGALLVNTARGGLLDYAPLPELLESGHLRGLGLDVYDIEPPPADWPLLTAPNVVLSPHLAGATRQTAERAATIIAGEVAAYLGGRELQHVCNPEALKG